jgi:hypothetical protein
MEKEYQELVECTFHPQTKSFNKQILKENIETLVPGAKSFI